MAISEVMYHDRIWVADVVTNFRKSSLWPICSGILFEGSGGMQEDGKNIICPFGASFLVDPEGVNSSMMEMSLSNPDEFLNIFPENFKWLHGRIIRPAEA
jgi:hypothetical protein